MNYPFPSNLKFIPSFLKSHISFLIFFCLFFPSCKSYKSVAPPHVTMTPAFDLKPSFISIPVNINIKDLESKLNKELNGLLYEDNSLDDNNRDNIMLRAWKKDNFSVNIIGNTISYRLPLKVWIKAGFSVDKFGIKISDFREVNAEIALKYKTAFTINSDWSLITKTSPDGYEWLSAPTISIAGMNVPIKYIADIVLRSSQKIITRRIDDTIRKGVDIRKLLEPAWNKLHKPFKINDEYNIWLRLTPLDVSALPVSADNNNIKIFVAARSVNEVFVGSEPPVVMNSPLPDLNIVSKLNPEFSLYLNTDIPFSKINELSRKEIIGKEFSQGRRKVKVNAISVYGSDSLIAIEVAVEGSIRGNIYLTGKPVYNPSAQTVEVANLDFDISTRNKLVKAADWLLHSNFIRTLRTKLNYSIADKIDEYSKLINQYLKENKSFAGLTISGSLAKMDLDNIYITDQSLKLILIFEGSLSINVNSISKI